MHGIPENTDLAPLVGAILEQLCIGLNEIILRFGDSLSLTVEGQLRLESNEVVWQGNTYREAANAFAALLGVAIVRSWIVDSKTLSIEFSNGTVVTVFDSKTRYESFQLHIGDRVVVV